MSPRPLSWHWRSKDREATAAAAVTPAGREGDCVTVCAHQGRGKQSSTRYKWWEEGGGAEDEEVHCGARPRSPLPEAPAVLSCLRLPPPS